MPNKRTHSGAMKANDVISTLKSRGIELWQEGGTLRYRARAGTLTERERATLRMHKVSILKTLAASLDNHTTIPSPTPVAAATTAVASPATECRNCQHFEAYPFEPILGSCYALKQMQHITSKSRKFGCSHFKLKPAAGQESSHE